jgi:rhamnosyltransferase
MFNASRELNLMSAVKAELKLDISALPPIDDSRVALVVPGLNAMKFWRHWCAGYVKQTLRPGCSLWLDSESSDETAATAEAAGFRVVTVQRTEFDHGGTRQCGVDLLPPEIEFIIFLTQDAVLADPDSLMLLLAAFEDEQVGIAYGRQLPRPQANAIEAHARLFNYPPVSAVVSFADRYRLGLKAAFASNSFSAYRRSALQQVGGFPSRAILSEDMLVAAGMLQAGWRVAYVAEATVFHSHGYRLGEEFERYFDIGALHDLEPWLLATFGKPEGEGLRFVRSELSHLCRAAPSLIPLALAKTAAKYAGYKLGQRHAQLPTAWRRRLSMNKRFWDRRAAD